MKGLGHLGVSRDGEAPTTHLDVVDERERDADEVGYVAKGEAQCQPLGAEVLAEGCGWRKTLHGYEC